MDERVVALRDQLSLAAPWLAPVLPTYSVAVWSVPYLFYPAVMHPPWAVQDDHKR
jgi:hypothetical protein